MKRLFAWPDTHSPFYHWEAVQVALNAVEEFNPDVFVGLGDLQDNYMLGSHKNKIPNWVTFESELEATKGLLAAIDARLSGVCEKHYIMGNHEYRHDRYYMNQAPELYGSDSMEAQLGLADLGWAAVPYSDGSPGGLHFGKLFVCHDVGKAGMYAAKQSAEAVGGSVLFGHTHRLAAYYLGNLKGERHVGLSAGWLGDPDSPAFSYAQAPTRAAWQHGFVIGYLFDDGSFQLVPTPIVNDRCVIEGKVIKR